MSDTDTDDARRERTGGAPGPEADGASGAAGPGGAGWVAVEPQEAFLELGRIDLTDVPLGVVLRRVAELTRATIPGADEVSVTLLENGRARSVGFTGELAVHLDERQYRDGFGPCMEAAEHGSVVSIPDTAAGGRYAGFNAVARRAGVGSSLSVGMPVPQRTVGGLNIYAKHTGAFDEEAAELARAFAGYAGVVLANAALLDSKSTLAQQMETAMASRAVIEQAKGILMATTGCTADEAFARLSRESQDSNRKLRQLAADLVERARGRMSGS